MNLCLSLNHKFVDGALTFIYSVQKNNPGLDFHVYIIDGGLCDEDKMLFNKLHPQTTFISDFDKKVYEDIVKLSPYAQDERTNKMCKPEIFYRYELFDIPVDQIIYCDSDLLCLTEIDALGALDRPFNACYIETPKTVVGDVGTTGYFHFNTGLMVIGKQYLNHATKEELISKIKYFTPPNVEITLNCYFNGLKKDINYIPAKYNVPLYFLDRVTEHELGDAIVNRKLAMIHYGPAFDYPKPWNYYNFDHQPSLRMIYKMWSSYYRECMEKLA